MSAPVALTITFLLLAGNAFFVGAEFALISARRDRLEALVEQGKRSAAAVIRAGQNLSLMLAGALTAHKVPLELHLFAHDGHGTSTCTREVNTPNKHNSAWVALCTDWLAETFDFHL